MSEKLFFQDVKVGDSIPVLVKKPVTHMQLVRYAGASGDFNPLHTDPDFGKKTGLGQIAHGMLIMGFVGEAVTNWIPKECLRKLSVRFVGMTRPGDVITVAGEITEKKQEAGKNYVRAELSAKNQRGEIVISGCAVADLPNR